MSQSLQAYMVPLGLTRALIGCKIDEIFQMHAKGMKKLLTELDEMIEECGADAQPMDPKTLAELRALPKQADPEFDALDSEIEALKKRATAGEDVMVDLDRFMDKVSHVLHCAPERPFMEVFKDDDEEDLPTARECLRHLFMGEPLHPMMGYAYDFLCKHLLRRTGTKLPYSNWTEVKRLASWLEQLDSRLGFECAALLSDRGNPLLPGVHSGMGYLLAEEVLEIDAKLKPMKFENRGLEDSGVYLADIRQWVGACAKEDQALVCFVN